MKKLSAYLAPHCDEITYMCDATMVNLSYGNEDQPGNGFGPGNIIDEPIFIF